MKKVMALICGILLQLGIVGAANAITITNGGFETGNFSGWVAANSSGSASVVTSATASSGIQYHPQEGLYFAKLVADSSILQLSLNWNAGDKIGFKWAFLAQDYLPFNDFAVFSIQANGPDATVVTLADVASVGDYGDTGWKDYVHTFQNAGNGLVTFGSTNVGDQQLQSVLLIDNVTNNPVPEPGTLLLTGAGLLGLAVYGKRRKYAKMA